MVNVGSLDRAIRLILGLVLLLAPFLAAGSFAGMGGWRHVIAAVGGVLIATAAFRFCPAYRLLGLSTCPLR
ncbi:YgaP family membrane protein [Falsiroseomonas sp.]|uniref:YgaP family membrane protein n=1 Tax=Falsiroseomonas sp. TaxID=2870721 RepID=UPI003F72009A